MLCVDFLFRTYESGLTCYICLNYKMRDTKKKKFFFTFRLKPNFPTNRLQINSKNHYLEVSFFFVDFLVYPTEDSPILYFANGYIKEVNHYQDWKLLLRYWWTVGIARDEEKSKIFIWFFKMKVIIVARQVIWRGLKLGF